VGGRREGEVEGRTCLERRDLFCLLFCFAFMVRERLLDHRLEYFKSNVRHGLR